MTESKNEFEQTRRGMPRTFSFPNGPIFSRVPLVHIVGGAILNVWETESGDTALVYRQPASPDDAMGRGAYIATVEYEHVPLGAATMLHDTFSPDEMAFAGHLHAEGGVSVMLLAVMQAGERRPGKN